MSQPIFQARVRSGERRASHGRPLLRARAGRRSAAASAAPRLRRAGLRARAPRLHARCRIPGMTLSAWPYPIPYTMGRHLDDAAQDVQVAHVVHARQQHRDRVPREARALP